MASEFFSSAPCSLGPGEVPNMKIKPTAHQMVCYAWPWGRPGISSILYGSRSLALTLFFESVTLHPYSPPASFVSCSPGKYKVCANRTKWSKPFSALPSTHTKKGNFFDFTDPLYTFAHCTDCKAWGLICLPLSGAGKIWLGRTSGKECLSPGILTAWSHWKWRINLICWFAVFALSSSRINLLELKVWARNIHGLFGLCRWKHTLWLPIWWNKIRELLWLYTMQLSISVFLLFY